jgi:hypothetical protein
MSVRAPLARRALRSREKPCRQTEFITLDGVIQAPGADDEDRDGGFAHGGWTLPYWHDGLGKRFLSFMQDVDALLLGRRTYVVHAEAFEPMAPGDPFGEALNAPAKYVVSRTRSIHFRSGLSSETCSPPQGKLPSCSRIPVKPNIVWMAKVL